MHRSALDHPRSRGVYPACVGPAEAVAGSSPLARGLRCDVVPPGAQPGIIPARAGFTHSVPGLFALSPDHPRSRGVYVDKPELKTATGGSSPLARGLRQELQLSSRLPRIIPARAGFTRFTLRLRFS